VEDEEEAYAWRALQAEARAFEAMVADVVTHGTPEDVLAMDALEEELDAKMEARFPRIEAPLAEAELEPLDIPF
jgi:hypothetical protein